MTIPDVMFTYSHTVGFLAYQGRGFIHPVDLALGDQGQMFVLNRGGPETTLRLNHKRVCVCTVDEGYVGEWGTGGTEDGQFWWPSGIARDSGGRLYITDESLQRVNVFEPDGTFVHHWGQSGDTPGKLNRPAAITIAPDDTILISDALNHRIQRFSLAGQFIDAWGQFGTQSGEFNTPWGLTCDADGNVYVADWRNDRVQGFTPTGRFVGQWGTPGDGKGQLRRPAAVAVDAENYLYVADWGNERVQVFAPDGEIAAVLRGNATTSSWAEDYLAANPDEAAARLAADLSPSVSPWRDTHREMSAGVESLFWGPTSVKLDDDGRIYVVDSCRHRVQIYRKRAQPATAVSR